MNKPNSLKLAQEWFDAGDNEFGYAEAGFRETIFYSQVCVSCQQAAEKYLKGFLVAYGKSYPKIHDLGVIVEKCGQIDPNFLELKKDCNFLTKFYVEVRYPPDITPADENDAQKSIEICKRIIAKVRDSLEIRDSFNSLKMGRS